MDVDGATEVDVATAKTLRDQGIPFVDVRAHVDYANGHVPGSANLSLVVDLSKEELAKVAGPDDEVAFYCHSKYCSYSALASAKAVVWGYKRVYRFRRRLPRVEERRLSGRGGRNPIAAVDNLPAGLAQVPIRGYDCGDRSSSNGQAR